MSKQETLPEWAKKYDDEDGEKKPVFKLSEGSKTIEFVNDGKPYHNIEFDKDSIVFDLIVDGTEMVFFCPAKAGNLVRGIRALGFPLRGKKAVISRIGKGRKDTKWSITPIEE